MTTTKRTLSHHNTLTHSHRHSRRESEKRTDEVGERRLQRERLQERSGWRSKSCCARRRTAGCSTGKPVTVNAAAVQSGCAGVWELGEMLQPEREAHICTLSDTETAHEVVIIYWSCSAMLLMLTPADRKRKGIIMFPTPWVGCTLFLPFASVGWTQRVKHEVTCLIH